MRHGAGEGVRPCDRVPLVGPTQRHLVGFAPLSKWHEIGEGICSAETYPFGKARHASVGLQVPSLSLT